MSTSSDNSKSSSDLNPSASGEDAALSQDSSGLKTTLGTYGTDMKTFEVKCDECSTAVSLDELQRHTLRHQYAQSIGLEWDAIPATKSQLFKLREQMLEEIRRAVRLQRKERRELEELNPEEVQKSRRSPGHPGRQGQEQFLKSVKEGYCWLPLKTLDTAVDFFMNFVEDDTIPPRSKAKETKRANKLQMVLQPTFSLSNARMLDRNVRPVSTVLFDHYRSWGCVLSFCHRSNKHLPVASGGKFKTPGQHLSFATLCNGVDGHVAACKTAAYLPSYMLQNCRRQGLTNHDGRQPHRHGTQTHRDKMKRCVEHSFMQMEDLLCRGEGECLSARTPQRSGCTAAACLVDQQYDLLAFGHVGDVKIVAYDFLVSPNYRVLLRGMGALDSDHSVYNSDELEHIRTGQDAVLCNNLEKAHSSLGDGMLADDRSSGISLVKQRFRSSADTVRPHAAGFGSTSRLLGHTGQFECKRSLPPDADVGIAKLKEIQHGDMGAVTNLTLILLIPPQIHSHFSPRQIGSLLRQLMNKELYRQYLVVDKQRKAALHEARRLIREHLPLNKGYPERKSNEILTLDTHGHRAYVYPPPAEPLPLCQRTPEDDDGPRDQPPMEYLHDDNFIPEGQPYICSTSAMRNVMTDFVAMMMDMDLTDNASVVALFKEKNKSDTLGPVPVDLHRQQTLNQEQQHDYVYNW